MSKETLIALRDNMVQRKNQTSAHIEQHLKDYKHRGDPDYTVIDNKRWAVKDARLSAQFVELSHFIEALNREIMS